MSSSAPAPARGAVVVELRPDLHLIALGKSRSGKTTWLQQPTVAGSLERAIVLDTAWRPEWLTFAARYGYEICVGEAAAVAALRRPTPPERILARCLDPVGAPGEELTQTIFDANDSRTTIADELAHWCRGQATTRGLRLITGSGMGRGQGLYGGTQRPVDIWNGFISEALRHVIFRLELLSDRRTVEEKGVPGVVRQAGNLDRFWWLYHSADDFGDAVLMRPIPI